MTSVTWQFWIDKYLQVHCAARGLAPRTIAAYKASLEGFASYVRFRLDEREPQDLTARDMLEYIEYLRSERDNGASAVNRQITILKNLYRAMSAMGYIEQKQNPLAHFPKIKAAPRKLPIFYSEEEVGRIISQPRTDTVLGLRDRALLVLLYGTGIRASECASLLDSKVDLEDCSISVIGKGGHERSVPLNMEVARALRQYRSARGIVGYKDAFFRSRNKRAMSRNAIYERVRTHGRRARIGKRVSPHRMRHTFATHLIKKGVNVVTVRDLLGHRCLGSTQIYLHTTAKDMREAAARHPVEKLISRIEDMLPGTKLPFQWPPGEKIFGAS